MTEDARAVSLVAEGDRRALLLVGLATLAFALALVLRGPLNVWMAIGLAAGGSLLGALVVGRDRLVAWFPPATAARDLAIGVGIGAAAVAATHLVYRVAVGLLPWLVPSVHRLYGDLSDAPGALAALPVLLLAVVAEELVWRGVLVDWLSRQGRTPGAIVGLATLSYAVPQIASGSWILALVGLGFGAVATVLRLKAGSLWVPLGMHAAWSASVFGILPLA